MQLLDEPRNLLLRRRPRFRRVAGGLQAGVQAGHDVVGGGAQPAAQLFEALILALYGGVRLCRHARIVTHAVLQAGNLGGHARARIAQLAEAGAGLVGLLLPGCAQLLQLHDAGRHPALAVAIAGHGALRLDHALARRSHPLPRVAALQVDAVQLPLQLHHLGLQRAGVVGVALQRLPRPAALFLQLFMALAGGAEVALDGGAARLQFTQPDQLQVALGAEYPLLQVAVLAGALDLVGKHVARALHFRDDRVHLGHVLARVVQLAFRFGGPRPVARDAGGFLEHLPPLLRLGG